MLSTSNLTRIHKEWLLFMVKSYVTSDWFFNLHSEMLGMVTYNG